MHDNDTTTNDQNSDNNKLTATIENCMIHHENVFINYWQNHHDEMQQTMYKRCDYNVFGNSIANESTLDTNMSQRKLVGISHLFNKSKNFVLSNCKHLLRSVHVTSTVLDFSTDTYKANSLLLVNKHLLDRLSLETEEESKLHT